MWNLKNKSIHIQNIHILTDIENIFVVTKGKREGEKDKLGVWD